MQVEDLKEDQLEVTVEHAAKKKQLLLTWQGHIHHPSPEEFLEPFLQQVVDFAKEKSLMVVCNFTELEYMNSSSLPPLIKLVRTLTDLKLSGEYIYDADRKIQAASFTALAAIAKRSRYVNVVGKKIKK